MVSSAIKSKSTPIPAKTQKELSAGREVSEPSKKAIQLVSEVIVIEAPA